MQETTSLWECSSTLERKTLPQTFICRACFPPPSIFSLPSFNLLTARSICQVNTEPGEKAAGESSQVAGGHCQIPDRDKKENWLVQIRVVCKGAPAQRQRALGQLELATSCPRVACQAEGLTGVRTLGPTGCTTGGNKGHFHNLYLVRLVLFFLMQLNDI